MFIVKISKFRLQDVILRNTASSL